MKEKREESKLRKEVVNLGFSPNKNVPLGCRRELRNDQGVGGEESMTPFFFFFFFCSMEDDLRPKKTRKK